MTPTSLALLPAQPDTLTSSLTRSLKHKHTCKHGNSLDHYGLRLGLPQAQVVCSNRRANTSLSVWEPREGGEKPWLRIIRESFSLLQMSLNCLHPCKNKALFLPHLMFPEDSASTIFVSHSPTAPSVGLKYPLHWHHTRDFILFSHIELT